MKDEGEERGSGEGSPFPFTLGPALVGAMALIVIFSLILTRHPLAPWLTYPQL
jgi:hypothetical protein